MVDGFSILTGSVGVVGVLGGVVSTIAALRTSGARRHVERVQGASAMLTALDALPKPDGGRLVTPGEEGELRDELSRIVRENAAAYVKQNPTPAGGDFARTVMPAYFVLFLAVSVSAFIGAARHDENLGDRLAGGLFACLSVIALGVTGILYSRMIKRNDARRLAGTPGQESYFGPVREIYQFGVAAWSRRRARRRERRNGTATPDPHATTRRPGNSDE